MNYQVCDSDNVMHEIEADAVDVRDSNILFVNADLTRVAYFFKPISVVLKES